MRILIVSRTNWLEPPRIRHQICNMLLSHGHDVIFLQKPSYKFFSGLELSDNDNSLVLGQYPELVHHQLRISRFIDWANEKFVVSKLKEFLLRGDLDLVLNFNYDYGFLKDYCPAGKFVTIINDDFVAAAKPWMTNNVREKMKYVAGVSDAVLAVSYPLYDFVKKYNDRSELFFPWCEDSYVHPDEGVKRNVVLYYGYINDRIDWDVVEYLLSRNVNLRFVGPVAGSNTKNAIEKFRSFSNFEIKAPVSFDQLYLGDVCCSIAPYDKEIESVRACTISNRAFRLLSRGIPMIYPDLPYLIDAGDNVITKAVDKKGYFDSIFYFENNFYTCQKYIKQFLVGNYEYDRYEVLSRIAGW